MVKDVSIPRVAVLTATFIMLILCRIGAVGNIYEKTFKQYYIKGSIEYLDSSLENSSKFFMTTSGAKAAVAVIEGSQIGVSLVGQLAIEAGDIVQPLYDIIHIMWKVSLLSLTSLGIQKIAITYFPLKLLDSLIFLFMLTWVPVYIHNNSISNFLYKVSRFILIIAMTAYILVPFSVYFSAKTSNYIYENHRVPVEKELELKLDELSKIKGRTEKLYNVDIEESRERGIFQLPNPKKKIDEVVKEAGAIIKSIELLSESILKLGTAIITIYLIDVIFLPLIFMFLIYCFIKIVILGELKVVEKRILFEDGINDSRGLKDELEQEKSK